MKKSVKILAIGNSFSDDCMEYVYPVLKSLGVEEIRLGNLYIGGCPLSRHCQNAREDAPVYEYRTNNDGRWTTAFGHTLREAIVSEEWDFIFTQQFSGESGLAETYDTLDELLTYVKGLAKGTPKFAWQMTWAYPKGSPHEWFKKYGNDQRTMYESIVGAVKAKIFPRKDIFAVIPTGTAIQNARKVLGDVLNRDDCHLSFGLGRYIAGLCVAESLTGLSVEEIAYAPDGVDEEMKRVAIAAVKAAVREPFND